MRKGVDPAVLLREESLEVFVERLAANSASPGGGSAAALSGSLGAALVSMVCRLTVGKKGYEQFEGEMQSVLPRSEALRDSLIKAIDVDAAAFDRVMEAFALPKGTEEEKATRSAAIQTAFRGACESPRKTAQHCLETLRLCALIVEKVNVNAISDIGVGATQALAGLEGAAMNVLINLPSIKDASYVEEVANEVQEMQEEGRILKSTVLREVIAQIEG